MGNKTSRATETVGVSYLINEDKYIARLKAKELKKHKRCKTYEEAVACRKAFEKELKDIRDKGKIKDKHSLCDDNCKDCVYTGILHWATGKGRGIPFCNYAVLEQRTRPCQAGSNCTVKIKGDNIKFQKRLQSTNSLFV